MNTSILITTLTLSISCQIIIAFINYLKQKREQPLKVMFMYSKSIPSEYEKLPYNANVNLYVLFSYLLLITTVIVSFIYLNWWQSILIFTLARLISTIITRLYISNKDFWNFIIILNFISIILLFMALTGIF